MTSKERVRRAITFDHPDSIPIYFFNRDKERSDIVSIGAAHAANFTPDVPHRTEWGYIMEPHEGTMGQPTDAPLQNGYDALDSYTPPDGNDPSRYAHLTSLIETHKDKFIIMGVGISGFNNACFVRGMTEFLMDLYDDVDNARRVLDIVTGYENDVIRNAAALGVDAISFADDLGTQKAGMISLDMFKEILLPYYQQQFKLVHDNGMLVYFHSCGQVWDYLPYWLEAGVDVFNLNQPDIFGIERLGAAYRGKVAFNCPVDHQTVAIHGDDAEIRNYVARLRTHLGTDSGGFIGLLEDYASCGMSEANYQSIKSALLELRS